MNGLIQMILIKALRTFIRVTLVIVSIPVIFVVRAISPFVLVRVGMITSTRLGHFTLNTELYLLETEEFKKESTVKVKDFVYFPEPVCNRYLAKKWRGTNKIIVLPSHLIAGIYRANRLFPGSRKHIAGLTKQSDRDISGLLFEYPPNLSFTQEEHEFGKALLRELGVPEDKRFICLNVRDSKYLATTFPSVDSSSHNYRDSNIEDYYLAAKALAKRGFYVLRMGAIVNRPLHSMDPMIIDYASSGLRSDFGDMYLGGCCFFCISVGSGFDGIPAIFRRPVIYVNVVPIEYFPTAHLNSLGIFKHHYDSTDGRELPFAEVFCREVGRCQTSECFQSKGITLRDNSPDEIMDAAVEMVDRLEGTFLESDDDKFLQGEFWRVFPKEAVDDYVGIPLHGEIKARISTTYLRSNRSLLGIRG